LTTDSERADPKILRNVSFINILQRFHRKFLSGNQRKILVTTGINGLIDMALMGHFFSLHKSMKILLLLITDE